MNSDDNNREKIDPDKLRNGLENYISSINKAIVYKFFARYVRKIYSDSDKPIGPTPRKSVQGRLLYHL